MMLTRPCNIYYTDNVIVAMFYNLQDFSLLSDPLKCELLRLKIFRLFAGVV